MEPDPGEQAVLTEATTAVSKRPHKAKAPIKQPKKTKTAAMAAKGKRATGGDKPAAARDGSKKAEGLGQRRSAARRAN